MATVAAPGSCSSTSNGATAQHALALHWVSRGGSPSTGAREVSEAEHQQLQAPSGAPRALFVRMARNVGHRVFEPGAIIPPRGHEFYAGVTGAQQCTGAERPHGDVLVAVVDRKMPQAFRAAFAARP